MRTVEPRAAGREAAVPAAAARQPVSDLPDLAGFALLLPPPPIVEDRPRQCADRDPDDHTDGTRVRRPDDRAVDRAVGHARDGPDRAAVREGVAQFGVKEADAGGGRGFDPARAAHEPRVVSDVHPPAAPRGRRMRRDGALLPADDGDDGGIGGTSRVAGVAVGIAALVDERATRTLPPASNPR